MGKSKLTIAKENLAAAQAAKDSAVAAFDAAVEGTPEKEQAATELAQAEELLTEAVNAVETLESSNGKNPKAETKTVKVRALLTLCGRFFLPYDPGTEFEIEEKQAQEIVDAKYGEFVK